MIYFLALMLLVAPSLVSSVQDSDVVLNNLHEVIFKLDNNNKLDLDLKWMASIDKWYVPIWSKLHSYRTCRDILLRDELSEDELKTSCLKFSRDGSVEGYGKLPNFSVKSSPESLIFTTPWKKMKGNFSFRLTDNKSYILGITSWSDGQISWAALSPKPKLSKEAETKIMSFVKELGVADHVANTYDSCTEPKRGTGNESSNEL